MALGIITLSIVWCCVCGVSGRTIIQNRDLELFGSTWFMIRSIPVDEGGADKNITRE